MTSPRQRPVPVVAGVANPGSPDPSGAVSPVVTETAATWVEREASGLAPAEAAELEHWLAADPQHASAYREQQVFWRLANRPRLEGRGERLIRDVDARVPRPAVGRSLARWAWAGAAAAALVVAGVYWVPGLRTAPEVSAVALRPDRQVLPDGSVIELNAGAEVAVDFAPEVRAVRLLRGEALFQVAKDAGRPFVVSAQGVDVRAVGTAFTVGLTTDKVNVLVTEGTVAVATNPEFVGQYSSGTTPPSAVGSSSPIGSPSISAPMLVTAGNRLVVNLTQAGTPVAESTTPDEVSAALAWRAKRVEFTLTPLDEAVGLFNRDNRIQLVLADRDTAKLRITGVFWTDDPEGFSRLLHDSLGLTAETGPDGRIVLRK